MVLNSKSFLMNRNEFEIEVCANSVESCVEAQLGGADRVELCAGIPEGGTTPSYGEIKMARRLLKATRLHVIIRNRGGDFLYSPLELERMAMDIDLCRELGVDGVVFGCLTPDGLIDREANAMLMQHVGRMHATFHRAFDRCRQPLEALEEIAALGFDRILTSGQQPTADQGVALLRQLNERAGQRLKIMAGCGVNERNIAMIRRETGVSNFHFSAREPQPSLMKYFNPSVYMGTKEAEEANVMLTTRQRVKNTINQLL